LAPQVVDPSPQIDSQLTAISVRLGVPKRKLMGSERGELASSQDDDEWNDKLKARQNNYITPRIIVPFLDRLISLGVLPEPGETGYSVHWPDIHSMSDRTKTEITKGRVEAMAQYVGGNVESIMHPLHFLTKELNFTDEEASEILDKVSEQEEEDEAEMEELMAEDDMEEQEEDEFGNPIPQSSQPEGTFPPTPKPSPEKSPNGVPPQLQGKS